MPRGPPRRSRRPVARQPSSIFARVGGSDAARRWSRAHATNRPTAPWGGLARGFTIGAVKPGTKVEVRSRFDQAWARGFEVAEEVSAGELSQYRVRRRSDGSVLPALFDDHELREE